MHRTRWSASYALIAVLALGAWACGGAAEDAQGGRPGGNPAGQGRPGGGMPGAGGPGGGAAVPVEIAPVTRRSVSLYLETNGTLEAENEVDIVTRIGGPIVQLVAEEGMQVRQGQVLARIDDRELRAQVSTAEVSLAEATRAHERAKASREQQLISEEVYDQALAAMESAGAVLNERTIQLGYTTVVAPFDGVIVERAVKGSENLTANQRMFRISDFNPLLCPIQVPEKELSNLRVGQPGYVLVEAWPGQRFSARVLRISPVIDATSGTIRVTLEVNGQGKLRPGMFGSVFLVIDTHENALVVPKRALSLESLADAVYVAADGVAHRRDVTLGFQEAELVEVIAGVSEGDEIIVVGQDGLSDGTPIDVLVGGREAVRERRAQGQAAAAEGAPRADAASGPPAGGRPAGDPGGAGGGPAMRGPGGPQGRGGPGGQMDPEQMRQRMRERGMSDEQIEERLKQIRERQGGGAPPGRL